VRDWHDGASQICGDAMFRKFVSTIFGEAPELTTPAAGRAQHAKRIVPATDLDDSRSRAPLREADLVLSSVAEKWLMSLPQPLRPAALCATYPRVVNRLALCWADGVLTDRLLEDLLIGRRGKRKGFPAPLAEELMRLRRFHDHYREVEHTPSVWEFRTLAPSDR